MKAKDLTQADVGKWVTLHTKIIKIPCVSKFVHYVEIEVEGGVDGYGNKATFSIFPDTNLEFTTPPLTVQEVGDTVRFLGNGTYWTIAAINGDACLLRYLTGHVSANYPLDPTLWALVSKGTQS